MNDLWVDKHCPKTLDSYVLNTEIKQYFKSMVVSKSVQNFTLVGCPGSGKTTLAKILAKETESEVLFVKCATEGTVDVLRTKVQEFCNAMTIDGRQKIVILDELDSASATSDNSFQKGLRTLIEAAQDDTRFICTANYQKIIPAVLSRCPIIPLKFDKKDLLVHVKKILDVEAVKYSRDSLKAFVEDAFKHYPDIRRIVSYLQLCCNSCELVVKLHELATAGKEDFLRGVIDKTLGSSILEARKLYLQSKDKAGDMLAFGSDIFNYAIDNGIVKSADGILKLTDLLYQLNAVVDKEPTVFGMLVAVKKYANG